MNNVDWQPAYSPYPELTTNDFHDLVKLMREDIVLADKFWLPKSAPLFGFQNISLRAMRDHFATWVQACRGTGKSYIVARYLLDEGLCNPLKIGFTAPTFRQALHPFNYVDSLIEENSDPQLPLSLSRERDGITVRGSMEAVIRLKNSTVFKALPMGNGERLRGERFQIIHMDEFFLMERLMFQSHLLPFLLGHRPDGSIFPKLIISTSAEFEDSFAYSVLTRRFLPKLIEEDAKVAADPDFKRTYCVLDWNVDDVREGGFNLPQDVLDLLLDGANAEECAQALYNKWIGTSGQFFPANLADRMSSKDVVIEHRAEGNASYMFSVDVARQRDGDFFVLHVFKFLGNRKMAFVNSYWKKGLTADEMAWKIMQFDDRFNPEWIVMDKGGGGYFVRDSLKKTQLEFADGTIVKVDRPILEHDEYAILKGERKLIFNRYTDELVRAGLAGFRSRGGEYIHTDDVLVHLLHSGMRDTFMQHDIPILIPAEYTDTADDEQSESVIFERIRTAVHQLRHLALELKELPDGQKEVVRSRNSRVPKYVWKSGSKDGASALTYGFLGYAIHYRGDERYIETTMPIIQPSGASGATDYNGMVDTYPDQVFRF